MKKKPPQERKNTINKRPGRIVALCTAKGKVIYCEDPLKQRKDGKT